MLRFSSALIYSPWVESICREPEFFCFCAMKPEPDKQTHTALSVFRLREIGLMRRYGDQAPFSNEKEAVAMWSGAETIA